MTVRLRPTTAGSWTPLQVSGDAATVGSLVPAADGGATFRVAAHRAGAVTVTSGVANASGQGAPGHVWTLVIVVRPAP